MKLNDICLLEMGFSREMVKNVLRLALENGISEVYETSSSLVDAVQEYEANHDPINVSVITLWLQ